MIAHAGGLPLEETIPQLAPLLVGAVVGARVLSGRARSWLRALDPRDVNRSQERSVHEEGET